MDNWQTSLRAFCILAIGMFISGPSLSESGVSLYSLLKDEYDAVVITNANVLVATIIEVKNQNGTNGNPPNLVLMVEQVLRGDTFASPLHAILSPPPHDVDWVGPGSKAAIERWAQRPLVAPEANKKYIFLLEKADNKFQVIPMGVIPYSSENLAKTKAAIQQGEEIQKKYMEEARKEENAKKQMVNGWIASTQDADISALEKNSDFIGIGKLSSYMNTKEPFYMADFEITKILKGDKIGNYRPPHHFVTVLDIPDEIIKKLSEYRDQKDFNGALILFLKLKKINRGNPPAYYLPVDNAFSFLPATSEKIKKANSLTKR